MNDDVFAQQQPPAGGDDMDMLQLPPLLLGTFTPKIDAKGRMALPAKFRSMLGRGVVLARGQERCVYLLPISQFRHMAMQIQRASVGDKDTRDYLRVFLSGASDQVPDKQGRVLVPQILRDYADLGEDIVVIGVARVPRSGTARRGRRIWRRRSSATPISRTTYYRRWNSDERLCNHPSTRAARTLCRAGRAGAGP